MGDVTGAVFLGFVEYLGVECGATVLEERDAEGEWKRVQTELAEAVKRAPEQPAEEMEKVFEKEKRFQDAGWVGFSDMNNGKEGK